MKTLGKADHEFLGSEFDWLALDQHGDFGYFSTAGEGWIPESVLADSEPFWESLDIVTALPVEGEPESCFSGTHDVRDWLQVAARGLYAFDWNRSTKRYELVARPPGPLVSEAAPKVTKLAGTTILPCSFSTDFVSRGPTAQA